MPIKSKTVGSVNLYNQLYKYDKYRYAKSFKLPKRFPNDPDTVDIKDQIFKANGNGWWVKYRVDDIHTPKYWVVSKRFKINGIWQT